MENDFEMKPVKSSFEYNGLKITLETQAHTVDEVLEAVKNVLIASGFVINGDIIVYNENEEIVDEG